MTAIGLGVAIPAAIAHNLFARSNRLIIPEYEAFAHECYLLLTLDAPSADPQTTAER
jgi:biopolymer transport protein ExbB/TolQ